MSNLVKTPGVNLCFKLALIFLAMCITAGCSSVDLLNATIPTDGYVRVTDIAYGKASMQKLDVYRPKQKVTAAPTIVFFYGGDWQFGSKADYQFVAQALTSRGFVVVLPDYRHYPEVSFPVFVEDGAQAVRWTHEHVEAFGGDPQHLFLMGHSSGAYIAAMLALDEHYLNAVGLKCENIKAAALLSGPFGFIPTGRRRAIFNMSASQELPDSVTQPMSFVDGNQPPLLLIQGLRDTTVYPSNTRLLAQRIHERGGQVETIYYTKRGHVGVVLSLARGFHWLAPTLEEVSSYLNRINHDAKRSTR